MQEYFEFQEGYRSGVVGSLVRKYHGIAPLLIKVEGLVIFTNTGRSHRLAKYYTYWEKRLFDSFVKVQLLLDNCCTSSLPVCYSLCVCKQMMTNNLKYYNALLQSGKLLFKVEALLSVPEIVLHPHGKELFKLTVNVVRDIVEGYVYSL